MVIIAALGQLSAKDGLGTVAFAVSGAALIALGTLGKLPRRVVGRDIEVEFGDELRAVEVVTGKLTGNQVAELETQISAEARLASTTTAGALRRELQVRAQASQTEMLPRLKAALAGARIDPEKCRWRSDAEWVVEITNLRDVRILVYTLGLNMKYTSFSEVEDSLVTMIDAGDDVRAVVIGFEPITLAHPKYDYIIYDLYLTEDDAEWVRLLERLQWASPLPRKGPSATTPTSS